MDYWTHGLRGLLYSMYRRLPSGRLRSYLKNCISFIAHHTAFRTENISIKNIGFKVYCGRLTENSSLLKDIEGYSLQYELQSGDIVIDAGAYNGMFTIYASKKVGPEGKVIALEPDPYNSILLEKNVRLNNLTNVTIIKKGLYDKVGVVSFDIQDAASTIVEDQKGVAVNKIQVTSIDAIVHTLHLKKVDFVKMDIEGAELHAVKGATHTIHANAHIHFAIASYHVVDGQQTSKPLEIFFKNNKMHSFTDYPVHQTTFAYFS